ncbi:MAG: acetophenone carboxylase [Thermoleophilia bacterium]|nr:acetophenone carboxylase [Thermoleophilia bacterium]
MERIRITEYLDLDVESESWHCHRCDRHLGPASRSYKQGCLVHDRDPREIHRPLIEGEYTFAPDPDWVRILEFYCPGCGTQVEVEYLPPGHPVTHDIELDVPRLRERIERGELSIRENRLVYNG